MAAIELFAVQPYMSLSDYADGEAFYHKIEGLFQQANALRSNPTLPALIAFPEDIATFLALAGQLKILAQVTTIDEGFRRIGQIFWRPLLTAMIQRRTLSLRQAFFAVAAPTVWRIWHRTMSDLARRFSMTTIAGSALIPENRLGYDQDAYSARSRSVYNLSVTYGPDGRFLAMTRKVNLVPGQEDVLDLTPGPADQAVISTLIPGTDQLSVATAICYDGFTVAHTNHEPHFQSLWPLLDRAGATILVIPSANPWSWDAPWPLDRGVPPRLRKEQWAQESLPAALVPMESIQVAVNPHLLASLLDVHFDGQSSIWARRDGQVQCLAASPSTSNDPASECVVHALWET